MISIIDYGMGNLLSVFNALDMLGVDVSICSDPREINDADRIILPGVGAFGNCMQNLIKKGFMDYLEDAVINQQKPILGICLGMQLFAKRSFEGGEHKGFGWLDADIIRITPSDPGFRVPHVGWNNIHYSDKCLFFKGLPSSPDFYFVHSYYMKCHDKNDIIATCNYGMEVTAAVQKNNIFATQFHPEKSQEFGLTVLENFISWVP